MIHRIDVMTTPLARTGQGGLDPVGQSIRHQIAEFGTRVGPIDTARIFLIDTDAAEAQVRQIAQQLLADPIVESAQLVRGRPADAGRSRIEVHLKPGVMDPVADSTEMAIRDMGINVREIRTGRAYLIEGIVERDELARIASRVLANGVVESVHFDAYIPEAFIAGREYKLNLRHVEIRNLSEPRLIRLSREGHLFLSLDEMIAIQNYYRKSEREPTDIELETLAQTWSEHCVHKTLKSAVDLEIRDEKGTVLEERHYDNLIKDTIFKSTMELMARADKGKGDFCLSVFVDNAGVIAFDETDAVCFKVETHNHPSAIEPYGGSATGIGGVIRDILGTGLAAKPIANTDVFCVAFPDYAKASAESRTSAESPGARHSAVSSKLSAPQGGASPTLQHSVLPKGILHPKRILQQVVAGVRDYGNRMGIPTVNGAVYFDDRYLGNPLVFCGCVGLIPRDKIHKQTESGDAIVVLGGRTGRDGIHGATFSSAELTDTHADEFSHAVQIGNAITEKKTADVVLAARDLDLFTSITDCGAGGLSSAVGEMGEKIGAYVELHKVPLKYAGLRYDEIWISEAQERMVLSVPQGKVQELLKLAQSEDVEATVIGHFGTKNAELILKYQDTEVGRLSMSFIHNGLPKRHAKAVAIRKSGTGFQPVIHGQDAHATPSSTGGPPVVSKSENGRAANATTEAHAPTHHPSPITHHSLLAALAHPNIASKHWIIRQYDHEVQGGSVIKPLLGPLQIGPSDAAVLRPKLDSNRGIAIGCGMAPHIIDPYDMAIASIDEAVRNVVAVGADPSKIAILDNFCWPSVDSERALGDLARACEACHDAAIAYRIPFISGKDSLNNQFTNQETKQVIRIPNTLLISAIAVIEDVRRCVTMDLKKAGSALCLFAPADAHDLKQLAATHAAVAAAIAQRLILSIHDVSDGGYVTAAAEMAIASGLGLELKSDSSDAFFRETNGCYVVEVAMDDIPRIESLLAESGAALRRIGAVVSGSSLTIGNTSWPIGELTAAWRGTLDW